MTQNPSEPWGVMVVIFTILILGTIGVLGILYFTTSFKVDNPAPPPLVITPDIRQPVALVDTIYNVDVPKKGVKIFLHTNWKIDPTDKIIIVFPNGRKLQDGPDIRNHVGPQQDGWYELLADTNKCQAQIEDKYKRP